MTLPLPADWPGPGLWLMTVFAGWSFETKRGLTWKPCACSVDVAWSSGRLRTFATAIGCGPFETLIRTLCPTGSFVPCGGSCAVTTPAGLLELTPCTSGFRCSRVSAATASVDCSPTRLGTVAFGRPVDTQMVTSLPFGCRLPASGDWLYTSPRSVVRDA